MAVWSIAKFSDAVEGSRLDAEFFKPRYLAADKALKAAGSERLQQHFVISDGNHLGVTRFFTRNGTGVPYFRGQDINQFFLENATPEHIPDSIYNSGNMKRSHFRTEDVLICIVGATTGAIGIVTDKDLPSTGSCKLGIIRKIGSGKIDPFYLSAFLQSRYGRLQIQRNKRGTAQGGLIMKDIPKLVAPIFSEEEQGRIRDMAVSSTLYNNQSRSLYQQAQQMLESELGLDKLTFEKPVGYTASFSDVVESLRTDAEYYNPVAQKIVERNKESPQQATGYLEELGLMVTNNPPASAPPDTPGSICFPNAASGGE